MYVVIRNRLDGIPRKIITLSYFSSYEFDISRERRRNIVYGSIGYSSADKYFMRLTPIYSFIGYTYRESLFDGRISSCKMPSSNQIQTSGAYKFSTFGYNPHNENEIVQDIPMHSYPRRGSSIVSQRLDSITTTHAPLCSYEPIVPAKYDSPSPISSTTATTITTRTNAVSEADASGSIIPTLRTINGAPKKNSIKMEQSQLMLEIRNSAPDVIIMTSQ